MGRYDTAFGSFEHFAFTANHVAAPEAKLHGMGGVFAFETSAFDVNIGVSHTVEDGAVMGMTASEAFRLAERASNTALSLALSAPLNESLSLSVAFEQGVSHQAGSAGGLVTDISTMAFNGFELGATVSEAFVAGDRLRFSISQPLRLSAGEIRMNLPVGRTKDGTVLFESVTGSLEPTGRQIDFGVSYALQPNATSSLSFGAVYSMDDEHVTGAQSTGFGAAYSLKF